VAWLARRLSAPAEAGFEQSVVAEPDPDLVLESERRNMNKQQAPILMRLSLQVIVFP